jgi:hypothetical protein
MAIWNPRPALDRHHCTTQAQATWFGLIEGFYNPRRQSTPGMLGPAEYEIRHPHRNGCAAMWPQARRLYKPGHLQM